MGWLRLVGSVELYVSFAKETIELYVSFAKDTMGWLRLVGSIELYVSFAKEPCKKDYILRRLYSAKETYNFKEPTNRSHPIPSTTSSTVSSLPNELHSEKSAHHMYCTQWVSR